MWLSLYMQYHLLISDLWVWYPIPLQKCWICFAPKWRRAALPSSISRKLKSLAGPPPPRRWREAHYKSLAQFWLNHCSPWRVVCSVSAAAGGLSRHPRDCVECRQLGTREGGIHFWMKMYKKCFYFSEDILLEWEQPRRAPAGSVNRPSNKCHVFHSRKVSRTI